MDKVYDHLKNTEFNPTIIEMKDELGISIILVTHFMDEAVKADRVVVMNEGQVCMDGTPREVFVKSDLLKSIGLTVPKPLELTEELKKSGVNIGGIPLTPQEFAEEFKKLKR